MPLRPVVCHNCYTALEPPSSHSCTACDATVAPQYCSTGCADADKPVHTALCGANLEIEEAAASDGRRHPRLAARMTMASIVPTPGVPEFVQYWEAIQALHAAAGGNQCNMPANIRASYCTPDNPLRPHQLVRLAPRCGQRTMHAFSVCWLPRWRVILHLSSTSCPSHGTSSSWAASLPTPFACQYQVAKPPPPPPLIPQQPLLPACS